MRFPNVTSAINKKHLEESAEAAKKKRAQKILNEALAKIDAREAAAKKTAKEKTKNPEETQAKEPDYITGDHFIARWEAQLEVTENEIERAKIKARIAKRKQQLWKRQLEKKK